MITVHTLIGLLVLLGIAAIVWWGMSQLTLPQPVRIIAIVVVCILGILILVSMFNGTPILVR